VNAAAQPIDDAEIHAYVDGQLTPDRAAAIEAALLRVSDGSYGQCEQCGSPIEFRRLQLTPFASRCFDCQSSFERNHFQKTGHTL
jgi:DnaK suppressor protein